MTINSIPEIIIIGAGPVGLTLALGLAQRNVRSLVIEKKAALDPHSRATLITPRGVEILNGLGLLPALLAQGQRLDAIRILNAASREPMLTFDFSAFAGETPTPFALALSQDRTEHILLDAVRATGLVEVLFNQTFTGYEHQESGVLIRTQSAGASHAYQARFLVGADGAKSAVRESLGWKLEGETYPTRAYLADVAIDPAFDLQGVWLADPKAESFTIAVRFASGVWRLIESAITDDVQDQDFESRSKTITNRIFGEGAWQQTLWTSAYRKHERRAEQFWQDHVILAGDAAHLNSPAGGQGLNCGLRDADALAWRLAAIVQENADVASLLKAYSDESIEVFDRDVRSLTNAIEQMETAPAWIRRIAFSAVGLVRAVGIEKIVARKLSMLDS
jgi:3-(3-hydroxy-phenyl)propionate hydroxylase